MTKSASLQREPVDLDKTISDDCHAVNQAWNNLSKVWTLPIIHTLGAREPARFNELKRRITGISATSLAERLTELEQLRVLERRVYPETPPRVEYSLTKKGWELHALLVQLTDWVRKWNRQAIVAMPTSK